MPVQKLLAAALALTAIAVAATPAAAAPKYGLKKVATATQPTVVTWAPDQPRLLYVAERAGRVRILKNGRFLRGDFLDLGRQVRSRMIEQGLLGLAFPPDYRKSRRFYVHYTNRAGNVIVAEYRRSVRRPNRANPKSRRVLLKIPEVLKDGGHNGGQLRFRGRQLYISAGDGNNPGDRLNQSQNPDSLRGKILRIIPRPDPVTGRPYRIPAGNPLVGKPGRDEIFAWGLRNPHTFFFDQPAGDVPHILIADVGQGRFEELNYLPLSRALGGNFGWKLFEGNEPYDCGEFCPNGTPVLPPPTGPDPADLIWPALTYSHDQGCAVIGGPVITDPKLPSLRGRLIHGDFCNSTLRSAIPGDPVTDVRFLRFMRPGKGKHPALNGIGSDRRGGIYPFSNFGPIYRLVEKPAR